MEDLLLEYQAGIRLYLLIGAFGLVALWETFRPLRPPSRSTVSRWTVNISLTVICNLVVVLIFPLLVVSMAIAQHGQREGLYGMLDIPGWAGLVIGVLVIDITRYLQHVALHRVPILWRLHRIHHSDLDYDLTTGLRFHPLESIFTVGINIGVVALLVPPPLVVLLYELVFILSAFWVHGNVRMPERIDRRLRLLLVTPGMHRIHHSVLPGEHNSNYSGIFSIWDRLFSTFNAEPARGHLGMQIGLEKYRTDADQGLFALLLNPFSSAGEGAKLPDRERV